MGGWAGNASLGQVDPSRSHLVGNGAQALPALGSGPAFQEQIAEVEGGGGGTPDSGAEPQPLSSSKPGSALAAS